MADDQFQASGNWWDTARNVRYESGASQSSSSAITNIANYAWQASDMADMKPRSSMDSSSVVFHDSQNKLQPPDSTTSTDPNLHMMGLGLSSQAMDWNQASLLRGEKGTENSFRSMLQESRTNFQQETGVELSQQVQWRSEKMFSTESSTNEFKHVNRGFSLDQSKFSPQYSSGDSTVTSQGLPSSNFQMDSSALYGTPSILQGLLGPDHNNQQPSSFENRSMSFPYPTTYGLNSNNELIPSWSKVPQFLRGSPPKQPPNNQLHFTNNAPFWNASEAANFKDVRSSFFPSLQPPFSTPNFEVQSKNISEVRESGTVGKKSGNEPAPKRTRNETPSPMPAFKVRKEKMGDRITALQQLVSPFGKTDTASVLSEAIEYIKFLHEQVTALSTPYMKTGAPIQIQQNSGKCKETEGPKQDLRSRGLCLVPVSSTFPVTHETTVDFWTPTFGGVSR
ncbi:transcription factor bHLH123-like [Vigna umbellata]|uniref:transcription factor bHLH123-like n=1 Tax=Vigna umbellata TaxID=87088 RepID=UPI001F5E4309|nr:transcription factor bHLH123-like [Vigna umbellata]XP_047152284.1 transcription factor bHLH123-like [Vigna umbellata]